jgi:hypothetical protein
MFNRSGLKEAALLIICTFCLSFMVMPVTQVHADILTLPQLVSPSDGTVIVVGPLTFSWTPAVVSAGDSIIEQQLQVNYSYGGWGYLFFESSGGDSQYTASESTIQGFLSEHQDTVQWQVYVVGLHDSIYGNTSPQTWSFNILKVPSPWVDNNSWAFSVGYSGGQIPSMDYQTFLEDNSSRPAVSSGYWWPLDNDLASVYVTLSSQPTLCWTNWQSDNQLTPVDFAKGYRVQVSTSQDFSSTVIDTTTQNVSYTTPPLAPSAYYWRVSAQNGNLATDWSPTEGFIIAEGSATVPEFPSFLILTLFMIATLLAVIVYRKKGMKTRQDNTRAGKNLHLEIRFIDLWSNLSRATYNSRNDLSI